MEKKLKLDTKYVDALEKVFPEQEPEAVNIPLTALLQETVSFQAAFLLKEERSAWGKIKVETKLPYRLRRVELVPCAYPCHVKRDQGYLKTEPGLFPDRLSDIENGKIKYIAGQWHSVWIDLEIPSDQHPGIYPVAVIFMDEEGNELSRVTKELSVIGAILPPLPIRHTEWFHADCLADFYHVEVWSDEFWEIMEEFLSLAAKRDCNMILTPMFTPPLDTEEGGERTTIQLVDIKVLDGRYHFDFTKFTKFIKMCQRKGFQYFEMSHLFTQWGVKAAPKIMATVNGVYQRIFGWDTPAVGGSYEEFLQFYLPELTEKLKELGIADKSYFHISDEPGKDHLENYRKAKEVVTPYLEGFQMMDALSDYSFYESGLVSQPVCATDHIEPFLEHQTPNLWSYYCTAQCVDVSNRFLALPSYRNRIYGLQVYKYGIKGILHWGYNFYNSEYSKRHINPYETTDCDYAFPGGDAFLVYPKKDGTPEESIRMMVHYQAMTDIRAMYLLERKIGRKAVLELAEEGMKEAITFSIYPHESEFCLWMRNRINNKLAEVLT